IEQQARAELIKAGADEKGTSVTVLSAYKQGYSWLFDIVRPSLEGKAIDRMTIKFAEIGPPSGWKQQGMFAPTRWLLELYPIDQEQISTMEALHEEIYFNTLHFFDVMGRFTRGAGLAYPGRVIPVMHPKADGKPGRAKISVTGFDAARPSVVVEYAERSGRKAEARLDIPKVAVE